MSNDMKPEDAHAERMQEQKFFNDITEAITKLSKTKYAELRQWLLLQPTIEDWQRLMKS